MGAGRRRLHERRRRRGHDDRQRRRARHDRLRHQPAGAPDSATRDAVETSVRNCESSQVGKLSLKARGSTVDVSWTHPKAWKKLRSVTVRVLDDRREIGTVKINPRADKLAATGAVELGRKSALTPRGQDRLGEARAEGRRGLRRPQARLRGRGHRRRRPPPGRALIFAARSAGHRRGRRRSRRQPPPGPPGDRRAGGPQRRAPRLVGDAGGAALRGGGARGAGHPRRAAASRPPQRAPSAWPRGSRRVRAWPDTVRPAERQSPGRAARLDRPRPRPPRARASPARAASAPAPPASSPRAPAAPHFAAPRSPAPRRNIRRARASSLSCRGSPRKASPAPRCSPVAGSPPGWPRPGR